MAPLENLPVQQLAPRNLHFEAFGQRVDDGNADPMQAARGLIGLLIEFAARMQRGHDDFERRFLRKFRMRINRNATPIVDHGEKTRGLEADIDEGRMAGDSLVHRIVEGFREKMMKGRLVGAADIHAWPPADRFEPFQHLDRSSGIAGFAGSSGSLSSACCFSCWRALALHSRPSRRLLACRIAEEIRIPCHLRVNPCDSIWLLLMP